MEKKKYYTPFKIWYIYSINFTINVFFLIVNACFTEKEAACDEK